MEEIWKPVIIEEVIGKYEISNLGRDFSVDGRAILNIYRKESWKWLTDPLD